ncbi:LPXTG cell wall anchor domain-containing protein [Streptomyces litchfieldiae]|uniref:LPXTG cell wall anchor domain-containing protein n=1 Tax=Streptomyces litchfieldiae TaxID=3075543 RepID=A0ABU2MN31_9ACTN|nr:LPXTG cell wall anchor domain-containing protein [Streptomyces sp. DSM 44938]MDT0343023.1 LPXTG cell wall anchor domain-containing protein [Streptomyces sp. DSM 44938]
MARVAAAAIFAAGASLAVVGTASADDPAEQGPQAQEESIVGLVGGADGGIVGVIEGNEGGQDGDEGGQDDGGTIVGVIEGGEGGQDGDEGGQEGEEGGQDGEEGGQDGEQGGTVAGVNEGGSTSGGLDPDTEGGSSPIEQDDPTEDITEPQAPAEDAGEGELAETGSSTNQTLLIIGAATMIAGGVAFRYLPRLINKGMTTA